MTPDRVQQRDQVPGLERQDLDMSPGKGPGCGCGQGHVRASNQTAIPVASPGQSNSSQF